MVKISESAVHKIVQKRTNKNSRNIKKKKIQDQQKGREESHIKMNIEQVELEVRGLTGDPQLTARERERESIVSVRFQLAGEEKFVRGLANGGFVPQDKLTLK